MPTVQRFEIIPADDIEQPNADCQFFSTRNAQIIISRLQQYENPLNFLIVINMICNHHINRGTIGSNIKCEKKNNYKIKYRQSWHSTGWKYSTKARHQYEQHFNRGKTNGNRKTLSKQDVAKLVNDWNQTDIDEVEYIVGGIEWLNAPDPNLISMHDWQKNNKKGVISDKAITSA